MPQRRGTALAKAGQDEGGVGGMHPAEQGGVVCTKQWETGTCGDKVAKCNGQTIKAGRRMWTPPMSV